MDKVHPSQALRRFLEMKWLRQVVLVCKPLLRFEDDSTCVNYIIQREKSITYLEIKTTLVINCRRDISVQRMDCPEAQVVTEWSTFLFRIMDAPICLGALGCTQLHYY
jgi:hypothetical protein